MNHDCTQLREELNAIKAQMKVKRLDYIRMMRKRYDATPKHLKARFLGEMPERMRALGMYADATLGTDIQSIIVRRWYRDEQTAKGWRRGYALWQQWLNDNHVDWAAIRKEWRKLMGLVAR